MDISKPKPKPKINKNNVIEICSNDDFFNDNIKYTKNLQN